MCYFGRYSWQNDEKKRRNNREIDMTMYEMFVVLLFLVILFSLYFSSKYITTAKQIEMFQCVFHLKKKRQYRFFAHTYGSLDSHTVRVI